MSYVTLTPACKDMANVDSNLQCGRGAKSNLGRRDEVIKRLVIFIFAMSSVFMMYVGCVILVLHTEVGDAKTNRPNLFIRLLDKGGLDHLASPPTSPFFQLAFDVGGVPPGLQWRWELVAARILPWHDPGLRPNAVFLHKRW